METAYSMKNFHLSEKLVAISVGSVASDERMPRQAQDEPIFPKLHRKGPT